MIINPVAAAAAVAARAFTGFMPVARPSNYAANGPPPEPPEPFYDDHEPFPTNQYYSDNMDNVMEENMHEQARELDDFMDNRYENMQHVQDAEILSKEQTIKPQNSGRRSRPPPLPDTNNPFVLLGLHPGANFDDARRAYKEMAKLYHPDVVLGPDASADERQASNWDFARINTAFDILKRKENEEVLEYSVFVDGEHEKRYAVVPDEESRRRDPHSINFDRIRDMTEYRKRHPKEKLWHEEDHYEYQRRHQNHNGFEHVDDANNGYGSYSRGKWWDGGGFGHISSNEQRWGKRLEDRGEGEHGDDFGISPDQNQGWNERNAFDHETYHSTGNNNGNYDYEYQPRNDGQSYANAETKQGYPYKDTVWNERQNFNDAVASDYETGTTVGGGFDYDPREKWWRADDPTFGDFAP